MSLAYVSGAIAPVKIVTDFRPNNKSNELVILLHGAYGYPFHSGPTKYQWLADRLEKKYNVGYYQSSRKFVWSDHPDMTFEDYADNAFAGKTFAQECEDVKKAIGAIMGQLEQHKIVLRKINLVGFSLGGIMSLLVAKEFDKVEGMLMVGTSIKFDIPETKPLFGDFPSKSTIRGLLKNFKGDISIMCGGGDDLSNFGEVQELFNSASEARSREIELLRGVDHRFICIDGANREEELNNYLLCKIEKMVEKTF